MKRPIETFEEYCGVSDSLHWHSYQQSQLEIKRLEHIIGVLKYHIESAHHATKNVEANTRIHDGRLEVWFLGEWVDVERANAEIDEAAGEQEAEET